MAEIARLANLVFDEKISITHSDELNRESVQDLLDSRFLSPEMLFEFLNDPELRDLKPSEETKPLNTDILGEYHPRTRKIVIYDRVCDLCVRVLRWPPASYKIDTSRLKDVVLAHESAHAVTHLGRDSEGRIWEDFETAEEDDLETFAQSYPQHLFSQNDPGARLVLEEFSKHQSKRYNLWKKYVGRPIQEVNEALLRAREKEGPPRRESSNPEDDFKSIDNLDLSDVTKEVLRILAARESELTEEQRESSDAAVGRIWGEPDIASEQDTFGAPVNVIPAPMTPMRACAPVLVVMFDEDLCGIETRIMQALLHLKVRCNRKTTAVIFWTPVWNSNTWSKYMREFDRIETVLKVFGMRPAVLPSSHSQMPGNPITRGDPLARSLNANLTGEKVVGFTLQGTRYEVATWGEMLVRLCETLHNKDPGKFPQVVDLHGTKRLHFSQHEEDLSSPREIPSTGFFIETDMGSTQAKNLARRIMKVCGLKESDVTVLVENRG